MKKIIKYQDRIWHDDTITGCRTLSEIIQTAQNLFETFGDAEIEFDAGYSNISECLIVYKEREETDSEYAYRLKKEQKQAAKERKEYERLKAKFGE